MRGDSSGKVISWIRVPSSRIRATLASAAALTLSSTPYTSVSTEAYKALVLG